MNLFTAMSRHYLNFILIGLSSVIAFQTLFYPWGGDHGIHGYIGWGLFEGFLPYTEFGGISTKGPFTFLYYFFSRALFGANAWGVRLFDLLTVIANSYLVCKIVKCERFDGFFGAALFTGCIQYYFFGSFYSSGRPDYWMTLPILFSLHIVLNKKPSVRNVFLVGILSGIAVMYKFTAGVISLGIFGLLLWKGCLQLYRQEIDAKGFIKVFLAGAGGFLFILLLCLIPYLLTGRLQDIYDSLIGFTLISYGRISRLPRVSLFERLFDITPDAFLACYLVGFGLALMGILMVLLKSDRQVFKRKMFVFLGVISLFVLSLVSIFLQKRTYTYYFIVVGPFVVLMAIWGINHISMHINLHRSAFVALVMTSCVASIFKFDARFSSYYFSTYNQFISYLQGDIEREDYLKVISEPDAYEPYKLAAYIDEHINPNATICLTGFHPQIFLYIKNRCPLRTQIINRDTSRYRPWEKEQMQAWNKGLVDYYTSKKMIPKDLLKRSKYVMSKKVGSFFIYARSDLKEM